MSGRFGEHDPSEHPGVADVYRDYADVHGGGPAPNLSRSLSRRPDILRGVLEITRALLFKGQLPPVATNLAMFAIANHNGCHYCVAFHGRGLEASGVAQEVIEACSGDFDSLPAQYRPMVETAVKAVADANSVSEADFETLRGSGLNDGEILELMVAASFAQFLNTWADLAGVNPE